MLPPSAAAAGWDEHEEEDKAGLSQAAAVREPLAAGDVPALVKTSTSCVGRQHVSVEVNTVSGERVTVD